MVAEVRDKVFLFLLQLCLHLPNPGWMLLWRFVLAFMLLFFEREPDRKQQHSQKLCKKSELLHVEREK